MECIEGRQGRSRVLFRWLRFNFAFFISFFLATWMSIILFPDVMLQIFGKWAFLMKILGAKNASAFGSESDMFVHILARNGLTLVIFFVIGLFLQSPIALACGGVFYALVAFLAPRTIGRSFSPNDWLLISAEFFALILSTSVASALAGDLYAVKPAMKSILQYWKYSWTRLWVRPVNNWRLVLREWSMPIVLTAGCMVALSVFVAWFETYGH